MENTELLKALLSICSGGEGVIVLLLIFSIKKFFEFINHINRTFDKFESSINKNKNDILILTQKQEKQDKINEELTKLCRSHEEILKNMCNDKKQMEKFLNEFEKLKEKVSSIENEIKKNN